MTAAPAQLPTPALLAALAARGWALAADGGRWVLTGNGDDAEFGSLDGLARWLAKQGEGSNDRDDADR